MCSRTALTSVADFPGRYRGMNDIPPLEDFIDAIRTGVKAAGIKPSVDLYCEPGRGLVWDGISLLVQVQLRKDNRLYINDGIYGSLSETVQGNLKLPARLVRPGGPVSADYEEFSLNGPTCDSLDVLPGAYDLPADVHEGDWLEIDQVGAYSFSKRHQVQRLLYRDLRRGEGCPTGRQDRGLKHDMAHRKAALPQHQRSSPHGGPFLGRSRGAKKRSSAFMAWRATPGILISSPRLSPIRGTSSPVPMWRGVARAVWLPAAEGYGYPQYLADMTVSAGSSGARASGLGRHFHGRADRHDAGRPGRYAHCPPCDQ